MLKSVILTTEQIGLLKNIINNDIQRPGGDADPARMIELGEILTALKQARRLP